MRKGLSIRPTNPVSLTPDYLYSVVTNANGDTVGGASYSNTSRDTTGNVLKYRSQNLVRLDAEWRKGDWFVGLSARYQSALRNIDQAWLTFEELGVVDWGLQTWLDNNPNCLGFGISELATTWLKTTNSLWW